MSKTLIAAMFLVTLTPAAQAARPLTVKQQTAITQENERTRRHAERRAADWQKKLAYVKGLARSPDVLTLIANTHRPVSLGVLTIVHDADSHTDVHLTIAGRDLLHERSFEYALQPSGAFRKSTAPPIDRKISLATWSLRPKLSQADWQHNLDLAAISDNLDQQLGVKK